MLNRDRRQIQPIKASHSPDQNGRDRVKRLTQSCPCRPINKCVFLIAELSFAGSGRCIDNTSPAKPTSTPPRRHMGVWNGIKLEAPLSRRNVSICHNWGQGNLMGI